MDTQQIRASREKLTQALADYGQRVLERDELTEEIDRLRGTIRTLEERMVSSTPMLVPAHRKKTDAPRRRGRPRKGAEASAQVVAG